MRIPFLILTPVSIFLGFAVTVVSSNSIASVDVFLVLLGALTAHISVNAFNEYFDFRSGLDAITSKTPFSGGSGALVDNPDAARKVLGMSVASLSIAMLIGLHFVFERGLLLLPIGIVGVLIVLTYTQWLNRFPILCLLAPGIGFGPLMVVGTQVVLTGEYTITALVVSLVPFFLASNILLLNQFPDIEADERVGRRHVPIVYGLKNSTILYGVFAVLACVTILSGVWKGTLPTASYLALLPLGLTAAVFFGAMKHAASAEKLIPFMGLNVVVAIVAPLVLGTSMIFG